MLAVVIRYFPLMIVQSLSGAIREADGADEEVWQRAGYSETPGANQTIE